jgi:peptide deformylase
MAVLRIAKMGNPVLSQVASRVADPTAPEIRQLAADMQETLEDIGASGLAAPQVFVSKRVVVYRMIAARIPEGSGIEPRPWTVMVNPVITPKNSAQIPVWERCLSIPGCTAKCRATWRSTSPIRTSRAKR